VTAPGEELLRVDGLHTQFALARGLLRKPLTIRAVDDVSFSIRAGETLGLVGESGCGKSTTAKTIVRLVPAAGGRVFFRGRDMAALRGAELQAMRAEVQILFQDPYSSLDPLMSLHDIIAEPLILHRRYRSDGGRRRVAELLDMVGIDPRRLDDRPASLSGGQRQRIGIARALALRPSLIILDEPVSALDVSVKAQILNLLQDLQDQLGVAYLFVSHDLAVVRQICHRVAVMYLGSIVEIGDRDDIFDRPTHPYTRALLSAAPEPDPDLGRMQTRILLKGELPSPASPPSGCRFRTRCWKAAAICAAERPALAPRGAAGHVSACHHPEAAAC
jgi:oligopeptide/dipeptide ABC transporter ATP-binding protein